MCFSVQQKKRKYVLVKFWYISGKDAFFKGKLNCIVRETCKNIINSMVKCYGIV